MIDLQIFVQAQEDIYEQALAELKNGKKVSHWMWFVFPQIAGLGNSEMARKYAIPNLADAKAYLSHDLLGSRLRECTEAVLAVEGRTAYEILGSPDDMKLKSCMTLFELADSPDLIFSDILDKYFECQRDERSLAILNAPLS
jgi:uncharacterized protein (DUF1810 family)